MSATTLFQRLEASTPAPWSVGPDGVYDAHGRMIAALGDEPQDKADTALIALSVMDLRAGLNVIMASLMVRRTMIAMKVSGAERDEAQASMAYAAWMKSLEDFEAMP